MAEMITKTRTLRIVMLAAVAVSCCSVAQGQGARGTKAPKGAEIALGKRYIDAINGFSLRPMAGVRRRREYSPSRLVSWSRRDTKTGAIDLTLMVLKRSESKKELDLKVYSKALVQKLVNQEQFKVDSVKLIKVDGRDAIDLRGVSTAQRGLYQRQVWVWANPPQFLILVAAGPAIARAEIDKTSQRILETFKVIDPAAAAKEHRENLKRGMVAMGDLTRKKLKSVFAGQRSWHLLRMKGKDVGYMSVATLQARSDGMDGYETRSLVKLQLPNDRPRVMWRVQFATADRNFTRWNDTMTAGSGRGAVSVVQKGIMQNDLIFCRVITNGNEEPKKKYLTRAKPFFLPRAFGMVLTQLVDLKTPASYSFATYTSVGNGFDMRTLKVVGPVKISIGGRKVDAVHVTDRAAADAEEAHLWVNAKGELLRMRTVEGLVMEMSTEAAILRRFPDDEMRIKAPRSGVGKERR